MRAFHFFFVCTAIALLTACTTPDQTITGSNAESAEPEVTAATESTSTQTLNTATPEPPAVPIPLAANDVTLLFPLPVRQEDLQSLIFIRDLKSADGSAVFSEADFVQMIDVAEGPASSVSDRQIRLSDDIRQLSDWVIAGIRFDPSAPGSSPEVIAAFGSRPQIRLVLQPVTTRGSQVVVHDVALHIIYDFVKGIEVSEPGIVGRADPDNAKVLAIIASLSALKMTCAELGIDTGGLLSIHPGLRSDHRAVVSQQLKEILSAHLHFSHFNSGAIMGLDNGGPEPWIFLSFIRPPESGGQFIPVPGPGLAPVMQPGFAQMISFIDQPAIQPQPMPTNRRSMTAELRITEEQRHGVSTAVLFTNANLADPLQVAVGPGGEAVIDPELINADIVDWVANPERSHFFNTDCASCHTESTRRVSLQIPRSRFAYAHQATDEFSQRETMPTNRWNVRNLGWFRNKATISIRTENETLEVVDFINQQFLQRL